MLADLILGHTPVCAVEWDPYCCEVLRERVDDGWFPGCTIWQGDVRAFPAEEWAVRVDCVHAGFPCQPHSVAGKRKGAEDDRNLWPATARVIGAIRPRWAFLENVPGFISNGFVGTVLGDLARLGYDADWTVLGADDVGATHRRKRWWCLAYRSRHGWQQGRPESEGQQRRSDAAECGCDVADADCLRDERRGVSTFLGYQKVDPAQETHQRQRGRQGANGGVVPLWPPAPSDAAGWRDLLERWPELAPAVAYHENQRRSRRYQPRPDMERNGLQPAQRDGGEGQAPESSVRGAPDGLAHRVQRLKALGNGQVPLAAAAAWVMLGGPCSLGPEPAP